MRIQIPWKEHKARRTDAHTDGGIGENQQTKYSKGLGFPGYNKLIEHNVRERSKE